MQMTVYFAFHTAIEKVKYESLVQLLWRRLNECLTRILLKTFFPVHSKCFMFSYRTLRF